MGDMPADRMPGHGARSRRASLLRGTALQAVMLAGMSVSAQAQLLPTALSARAASLPATALPTGGQVVAGAAAITQNGTTLNVNQSTANAGINWRSFDVGTAGTVSFTAPSPQSITINRVVGPQPSVIAGRITANNQQVLINQSGVLFTKGSQVDTQSLVVSAIGITDANLKAGRLVLDQPARPGAAVVNQGNITVQQTGLAALVAPQVANSGVIQAKFGHVVLAGAEAATVDLYGDGLLSIDVTKQVTTAPLGPDGKPVTALVTNTGTIAANGGTVLLTAKAAEGIVTNLVLAGGKITADTARDAAGVAHAGKIAVTASGGGVAVTGTLSAQGRRRGTKGGQIEVNATDTVGIGQTAIINASGRAGGGTVAIGTTLARAKSGAATAAPVAKQALIAAGATIKADATQKGKGGTVTVLSTDATYQGGQITARGGRDGGDGGFVEVSGETFYRLTGSVDVSAASGAAGTILIDPRDLTIGTDTTNNSLVVQTGSNGLLSFSLPDQTGDAVISPAAFASLTGNVVLQASRDLTVNTSFTYNAGSLVLEAGNNLTVASGAVIGFDPTHGGNLTLAAAAADITGHTATGTLTINGAVSANTTTGTLTLSAGTGGIVLNANASGHVVTMSTTGGGVSQTAGIVTADTLTSSGVVGTVALTDANAIGTLGAFAVTGGDLTLVQAASTPIAVTGAVSVDSGRTISLTTDGFSFSGAGALSAGTGVVEIGAVINTTTVDVGAAGSGIAPGDLSKITAGTIRLGKSANGVDAASITFNGNATTTATLDLETAGSITQAHGTLSAGGLTGAATGLTLNAAGNAIANLGAFSVGSGNFVLTDASALTQTGSLAAGSITLADSAAGTALTLDGALGATSITLATSAGGITLGGNVTATGTLDLSAGAGGVTQSGGTISAGTLVSGSGVTGGVSLTQGGNAVTTLGAFDAGSGSFALTDASALTQTGTLSAGSITLTDTANATAALTVNGALNAATLVTLSTTNGGMVLNGNVSASATGTVDLSAAAHGVDQTGGTLTAGTLQSTGGVTGNLTLGQSGNLIGGVSGFTVTSGNVTLADAADLTVTGSLGGGTVAVSLAAGKTLTLGSTASSGTLAAGTVLSVSADQLAVGTAGGTLSAAGTIELAPTTAGRFVALGTSSSAGTLGIPAGLGISTSLLRIGEVGGTTTVGEIAIAAATDLTGKATTLDLHTGGTHDVSQLAGAILTVGTLTGTTGGSFDLSTAINAIGTIGNITVGAGSFALADSLAVDLAGAITAPAISISSTAAGTAITVDGSVVATGSLSLSAGDGSAAGASAALPAIAIAAGGTLSGSAISLTSLDTGLTGNAVNEAATGVVRAGTLTGGIASGGVNLVASGNTITTLGAFSSDTASGLALSTSGTLQIGGNVTAGTLDLSTGGALSQTGGTISAVKLQSGGGIGGNATLTQVGNQIQALGALAVTGTLALRSDGDLAVNGAVSATGIGIELGAAGAQLDVNTAFAVSAGGTLSLQADQIVVAGGGSATLLNANTLGLLELASFTAADLTTGAAGPASASVMASVNTGTLHLGAIGSGAATASNISLDTLDLTGKATTLRLDTQGGITQSGALTVAQFSGAAGTTIALTNTGNAIGTITAAGLQAATGVAIADSAALTVAGTIGLSSSGTISIATDNFGFSGVGALSAPGGTVEIGPLTGAVVQIGTNAGSGIVVGDLSKITAANMRLGSTALNGVMASAIDLVGNASTSADLRLDSAGAITQSAGTLSAGMLTGSAGGDISLAQSGNVIAGLGSLTAGGSITVADSTGTLVVSGTVSAGADRQISLAAPAIAVGGELLVPNTAGGGQVLLRTDSLAVTGTISDLGGVAAIAPLTSGGTMSVGGTGGLQLDRIAALTLRLGSLDGTSLLAGGITFTAAPALNAATTTLALYSTGTVSQSSGAGLTVGTLSGVAGAFSLGEANAIGTVAGLTASSGDVTLADTGTLTVAGPVQVSAGHAISLGSNVITITSTAADTLRALGGAIAVSADTLTLPGTPVATLIDAGSGTVSLLPFTSGLAMSVDAIGGSVTAGTLELGGAGGVARAGSLTLGALGFSGDLVLDSQGTIGQTGSLTLTSGTLSVHAGGDVMLTDAGNAISSLGAVTVAGGGFSLTDASALTQSGTLSAATILLTDSATGTGLTIDGALQATTSVTLSATAGGIVLAGTVDAGAAGLVDLSAAAGGVNQTGGTIQAGNLVSGHGVTGGVTLTAAGNAIAALGGFDAGTGSFALTDASALTQSGTLTAGSITLTDSNTAAAAITINGSLAAGGITLAALAGGVVLDGAIDAGSAGVVDLSAGASGVDQTGGIITAGTLRSTGGITGDVTLTDANLVSSLGAIAVTGGDFTLVEAAATPLAANGTVVVESGHTISLTTDTFSFGAGGALQAGTGLVEIGPVTNTTTVDLGGSTGSGIEPGDLSKITAGTIRLGKSAHGVDAASIAFNGNVTTTATLDLETVGSVTQSGGTLSAGGLTGAASGLALNAAGNAIADLGSFDAGSFAFSLTDAGALTQTGTLTAGTIQLTDLATGTALTVNGALQAASSITLVTTAGGMTLAGTLDATSSGVVDLSTGAGGIDQTGGVINAGTLRSTGGIIGGAILTANNTVAVLGNVTATGGLSFTDSQALTVSGVVDGGPSVALNDAVSLTIPGSISATTMSLISTGTIGESGTLTAGTLTGSGTVVSLLGASAGTNQIATLGSFTATGGLTLNDGQALTVSGVVNGGPSVALNDAVSLTIPGSVSATTISLISTGTIGESGTLTAGTLTGSGTVVNLVGASAATNQIATLGSFTATGGLTLNDGQALTVSGVVDGGPSIALNDAVSLMIPGSVSGTAMSLISPGTIGESGTLTAGTLTGSGTVVSLLGASAGTNQIGTLGSFTATGGLTLNDGQALTVSGVVNGGPSVALNDTVSLTIPGSVSATTMSLISTGTIGESGTLTAGTLTGSGTVVSLLGASATSNQIATLGSFTATGGLTLNDGQALTVSGVVNGGPSVALNDAVSLTIPGSISATTMSLISTGTIGESGTLTASMLTGSGTVVNLVGASAATNQIATLGSFTATGGLTLYDGQALTVSGVVAGGPSVVINDAASLTIPGSISATTMSLISTGTIGESGTLTAGTLTGSGTVVSLLGASAGTNQIATLGSFTATGGLTLNDGQALTVSGVVSGGPSATIDDATFALSVPGSVTASAVSLSGGSLTLAGSISGSSTVSLVSTGTIGESGTLTAGTLTGSGTVVSLLGASAAANQIATLGSFTATGGLALNDGQALTVSGVVTGGPSVAINDAVSLTIPGSISATTMSLISTGTIGESGTLTASTLTGSGTVVSLLGASAATNQIATLGSFTATGGLTMNDGQALTVNGVVDGGPSATINDTTFALSIPGSVTASAVSLSGGSLTLAGSVSGSSTVSLVSTGTIDESGTLTAGTLTGSGTVVSLLGASAATNQIGTLGSFTATGGLTLNDGQALTVSGVVAGGPSVAINDAESLTIPGSVSGSAMSLISTGTIGESGTLMASTLTGSGTVVNLLGASVATNQIATLGSFTATGGLTLNDGQALTVSGVVDGGPSIALNDAVSLSIPGSISATTMSLISTGTIGESGTLTAGTLTGSGTVVNLVGASVTTNQIATLGSFTATGGLTLNDGQALTVSGVVNGGPSVALNDAVSLTIPGSVSGTAMSLISTGTIGESGTLTAGMLTGSGTVVNLVGASAATNQIATLGSFTATGGLTLYDGQALTVSGVVAGGPSVVINDAASLTIPGSISATTMSLISTGTIGESGTLTAGTLTGSGTVVSLLGASAATNQIATLGSFTATGGLTLNDGQALTVSGVVDGGPSVALNDAVSLTIPGSVSGTVMSLISTGTIGESGTLTAGTLTGSGTVVNLVGASATSNQIATLGGFTATGGLTLNDGQALTVSGVVNGGPSVALNDAVSLTIPGSVSGTAMSLISTGTIGESGTLTASMLTGSGTVVSLLGASATTNQIATLGSFTATGGLTLNDGEALTVSGVVDGGPSIALNDAVSLTIPGSVSGTAMSLISTGTIGESGTLTAGTLTGSGTVVSLLGASTGTNQIATLGSFTATGGLTLNDGQALTVSGVVDGGPSIALNDAVSLTIPGSVSGTVMSLISTGTIGESGTLTAGTLTGSGTVVNLVGASATSNQIATLGGFTATGGLTLNDGQALTVSGVVNGGPSVALNDAVSLTIPGSVSGTAMSLISTGTIGESGTLTAGTLTGSGTVVSLLGATAGTNQIATLGSFTATGGLTLNDGQALTVSGVVAGGPSVAINDAVSLTIPGSISATTMSLISTGTIGESGTLTAGTLTGSGTVVSLLGASAGTNQIATLGSFTATGGLTLNDGQALTVSGVVNGGPSVALNDAVSLTIPGSVSATTMSLISTGTIGESGTLTAGTLTGSGTVVSLLGASATSNQIATLGSFTATGGLTLNDGEALTVSGVVDGGPSIALNDAVSLTIPGSVSATMISLISTGTISESGTLTAGMLTGRGTVVSLLGASATTNQIATLGSFTATGGLTLNDGQALTVSGMVDGGPSVALNDAVSLTIPGSISATTMSLISTCTIGESGTLTAGTLTGSGAVVSLLGASAGTNQIATLGSFTATGGLTLNDGEALTVSGVVNGGPSVALNDAVSLSIPGSISATTMSLISTGTIGESGALTASMLTGSGTVVNLLGASAATNQIATLGNFIATGGLALNDGQALTVSGVVNGGPSVALNDAVSLSIPGNVSASTLSLISAGTISESGALTASTLTGSGTVVNLLGASTTSNQIATLGNFTATGGLALNDGQALTVSGAVNGGPSVALNDAVSLSIPGNVSASTISLISAGAISESGALTASTLTGSGTTVSLVGSNQIATLGSFTANGSLTFNDGQSLTLAGPVSAAGGSSIAVTGALTLAGTLASPGQSVDLTATGALSQPGGQIIAGIFSATAASISLGQNNQIGTFGNLISSGLLSVTNGTSLSIAGLVSGSDVAITTTGAGSDITLGGIINGSSSVSLVSSGGLVLAGQVNVPGLFDITAQGGNVIQTAGTVSAALLRSSGGIAGSFSLSSSGNRIGTLGALSAGGGVTLADTGALTVAGPLTAGGAMALSATAGITLDGNVTGPSLDLATAAGGVSQSGGVLAVGTLTAAGGVVGGMTLGSAGNRIAAIGPLSVSGGDLTVIDSTDLSINGPASAPNIAISTPGSIGLPGTVTTGTLALTAGGTIVRPAGAGGLNVGLLTGSAFTLADFGTGANVAELGRFVVTGSTLTLDDARPLLISGPLSADFIGITATDQITLTGTITTTGVPLQTQLNSVNPANPGSYFAVRSSGSGAVPTIDQIGTLLIQPSRGADSATVRLDLPASGGTIELNNLVGPAVNLILYTRSGQASGNINVGQLYVVGSGGGTNLTGIVGNASGPEAARTAKISPNPAANYRLNSCPIASVNCVLIPLGALPITNPLRDFVLDTGQDRGDDDDLALPDVSSTDY